MNLDITLFVNEFFDVKSKSIKSEMRAFIIEIINDDLMDKNLFNFHKNKT